MHCVFLYKKITVIYFTFNFNGLKHIDSIMSIYFKENNLFFNFLLYNFIQNKNTL